MKTILHKDISTKINTKQYMLMKNVSKIKLRTKVSRQKK